MGAPWPRLQRGPRVRRWIQSRRETDIRSPAALTARMRGCPGRACNADSGLAIGFRTGAALVLPTAQLLNWRFSCMPWTMRRLLSQSFHLSSGPGQ
eukprot:1428645-Alexandrium_andersonii.AAC.1